MCIFSQPVEDVSDTSIFARLQNGSQYLVYRMSYAATTDLAMVLPLPVPRNSPDDAVRFINLDRYSAFFDDMLMGFPIRGGATLDLGAPIAAAALVVHEVGDFDASFVPTLADFTRLDERFRLSDEIWASLPQYRDFGFAVFKLKSNEKTDVHPMAFEFPTRMTDALYFPTIHVHGGNLPLKARFDHMLYCQIDEAHESLVADWSRSIDVASHFMNVPKSSGIINGEQYCWSRRLMGMLDNRDVLIGDSDMA